MDYLGVLLLLIGISVKFSTSFETNSQIELFGENSSKGGVFICNITEVEGNFERDTPISVLGTPKVNAWTQFGNPDSLEKRCLSFAIKANRVAKIALLRENLNEAIEFTLGLVKDGKLTTTVRQARKVHGSVFDDVLKKQIETPGIISESIFNQFWITWNGAHFKIGEFWSSEPFLDFTADNAFKIAQIFVKTPETEGKWILLESKCPSMKREQPGPNYVGLCKKYEEHTIQNDINLQNILLNEMKQNLQNFKDLSPKFITKSYIEKLLDELKENYSRASELNKKILNASITETNLVDDYIKKEIYNQIKSIFVEYSLLLDVAKEVFKPDIGCTNNTTPDDVPGVPGSVTETSKNIALQQNLLELMKSNLETYKQISKRRKPKSYNERQLQILEQNYAETQNNNQKIFASSSNSNLDKNEYQQYLNNGIVQAIEEIYLEHLCLLEDCEEVSVNKEFSVYPPIKNGKIYFNITINPQIVNSCKILFKVENNNFLKLNIEKVRKNSNEYKMQVQIQYEEGFRMPPGSIDTRMLNNKLVWIGIEDAARKILYGNDDDDEGKLAADSDAMRISEISSLKTEITGGCEVIKVDNYKYQ